MNKIRRIAVSRLHMPDGTVCSNQVLEILDGKVVRHYPLQEELPFTEWHPVDYFLSGEELTLEDEGCI